MTCSCKFLTKFVGTSSREFLGMIFGSLFVNCKNIFGNFRSWFSKSFSRTQVGFWTSTRELLRLFWKLSRKFLRIFSGFFMSIFRITNRRFLRIFVWSLVVNYFEYFFGSLVVDFKEYFGISRSEIFKTLPLQYKNVNRIFK